jgi:hypothetical protein
LLEVEEVVLVENLQLLHLLETYLLEQEEQVEEEQEAKEVIQQQELLILVEVLEVLGICLGQVQEQQEDQV